MSYYDSDVADRAVRAFWRWSQRSGAFWQQPNRYLTETKRMRDGQRVIEIHNCNGLLAKYAELPSGRLRRVV
jgi:hypothetical protein